MIISINVVDHFTNKHGESIYGEIYGEIRNVC
jgi:hypothetical protein